MQYTYSFQVAWAWHVCREALKETACPVLCHSLTLHNV